MSPHVVLQNPRTLKRLTTKSACERPLIGVFLEKVMLYRLLAGRLVFAYVTAKRLLPGMTLAATLQILVESKLLAALSALVRCVPSVHPLMALELPATRIGFVAFAAFERPNAQVYFADVLAKVALLRILLATLLTF